MWTVARRAAVGEPSLQGADMAYDDYDLIRIEVKDGVAVATVDAPPINVMTLPLFAEIARFGQAVGDDDSVRVPDDLRRLIPGMASASWKSAYSDGHDAKPWRLDMSRWLLNDILVKVDKMSMGASLEARVPFLDHRLVEYMSRLSDEVRGKWLGKRILKKAFEKSLPASVFARKKAPFKPPVRDWLRGEAGNKLEALFLEDGSFAKTHLDAAAGTTMIKEHRNGADHALVLWQLFTLEVWWRKFFKNTSWR